MEPYATIANVLDAIQARRGPRIAFKSVLVLAAAALSTGFFGVCVPFFLLSMQLVPDLGVVGVLYVYGGGLGGLVFGAVSSSVSLSRTDGLMTRYYAILFATLAILSLGYLVAYLNIEALQRHV